MRKMNNWFSEDGSNTFGYEQIENRLRFLRNERRNLPSGELSYEVWVIKSLVGSIPNETSRKIYTEKVEKRLEELNLSFQS